MTGESQNLSPLPALKFVRVRKVGWMPELSRHPSAQQSAVMVTLNMLPKCGNGWQKHPAASGAAVLPCGTPAYCWGPPRCAWAAPACPEHVEPRALLPPVPLSPVSCRCLLLEGRRSGIRSPAAALSILPRVERSGQLSVLPAALS